MPIVKKHNIGIHAARRNQYRSMQNKMEFEEIRIKKDDMTSYPRTIHVSSSPERSSVEYVCKQLRKNHIDHINYKPHLDAEYKGVYTMNKPVYVLPKGDAIKMPKNMIQNA
jgi:hypothetical protein